MKKICILIALPFICSIALSAQITQEQADEIVLEHISQESVHYSLFAKEDLQENMIITTAAGEILELDYPCWVYLVEEISIDFGLLNTQLRYLFVKKDNGNLLEVITTNDFLPHDLEEWRRIGSEVPFMEFSLVDTSCQWTNLNYDDRLIVINSWENYISCSDDIYPEIDFSKQTLLLVSGNAGSIVYSITKSLQQLSADKYRLSIVIIPSDAMVALPTTWSIALVTNKLRENSNIELNVITIKDY